MVARAVRLISEGGLDGDGVEALAARLGVGERHLRRLFLEHLGASPVQVAQSRRLHHARSLLEQTDLSIADVAYAAGYASLRRFNACVRKAFRQTPSAIRRAQRPLSSGRGLTLELRTREPFDWATLLAFFAHRAVDGVEHIEGSIYRRSFHLRDADPAGSSDLDDAEGVLEVRPSRPGILVLELHGGAPVTSLALVDRVRRLFDLGANPAAVSAVLQIEPALSRSLGRRGDVRVPGAWTGFEVAVRAIVGQQISVAGARCLLGRIARTFGRPLRRPRADLGVTHTFPSPFDLASADLTKIGLTQKRSDAIRALCAATLEKRVDLSYAADPSDLRRALCALPGVGPWTAEYVAMRAIGDPDAFPETDLGIRRALAGGGPLPDRSAALAWAEPLRPYRAYAAMMLWRGDPGRGTTRVRRGARAA